MCLFTKNSLPSIATKNIFCYKLMHHHDGTFLYATPIMNHLIPKLPFMLDDTNKCGDINDYLSGWTTNNFIVSKGFIHAYQSIYYAKRKCSDHALSIILCVIPKGTKYYLGEHYDICAKKMLFTDIIIKEKYSDKIFTADIYKARRYMIIYNIKSFLYELKKKLKWKK